MKRKYLQLALLHTAVALTTLPVDDVLNRVMGVELGLPLTLVTLMISLPYFLAPMQVAIGSWADQYPLWGRRRTPYVGIGLALSVAGVGLSPLTLPLIETSPALGIALTVVALALWALGYNFATVSYFSLASELFGPAKRSRAISVMYFVMLVSVIIMGIVVSRWLDPFTPQALTGAVWLVCGLAALAGGLGLVGLEPRQTAAPPETRLSLAVMFNAIARDREARLFFIYLLLLLTAILGQDALIEPFAGTAFGMSVSETARLRSIYGVCFLLALGVAALAERWLDKRGVAQISAWAGVGAFGLMALSGLLANAPLFYMALVLLGTAIGVSTVSNHSLMLDMTTPVNVGLFIGAWGMATSLARLGGAVLGGVVKDVVAWAATPVWGYAAIFLVSAALLAASLLVLRRVDIARFIQRQQAGSLFERAAQALAD